jgi:hypothetical protein
VVVDLEKEKEETVHYRMLAAGWPDSPRARPVIFSQAAQLAENENLRPDARARLTCASGHLLKGGEITWSDAQEEHQVIADVRWC